MYSQYTLLYWSPRPVHFPDISVLETDMLLIIHHRAICSQHTRAVLGQAYSRLSGL